MLTRRQKRAIVGTVSFVLIAALILFSIGRFFANRALERQLAEERATLRVPEPMIVKVARATVERRRTFAGRAEPWVRATLAPEVAGTVVRVEAEVGQTVKTDALLLALEDAAARAAAEAARIQAEEAQRREAELDVLVQREAVATTDRAAARAAAAAAKREAERAGVLRDKHRLVAPFAGTIQARNADVGDYLNPGQPAFELVDLSRLRIVFFAGEGEIGSFTPGREVTVAFPALAGRVLQAPIRHVAPAAGQNGLFRIEAELANADASVPGGLAVTVGAAVRLYPDTLFVPTAAVRFEGARAVVQRRNGGVITAVPIEVGPELEGRYPVVRGLEEGDELVVR